jgi:hypothetical protein
MVGMGDGLELTGARRANQSRHLDLRASLSGHRRSYEARVWYPQ